MLMYVRSEQRRSRSAEGSVGVRCALSFCPPLQHQHFSATSSPPPQYPVIPSAPHRLRKAEDFACSVRIVSVAVAV